MNCKNLKYHKGDYYTPPWVECLDNQNPDGSLKEFDRGTAFGGGTWKEENSFEYVKPLSPILRMALEKNEDLDDYGRILEV